MLLEFITDIDRFGSVSSDFTTDTCHGALRDLTSGVEKCEFVSDASCTDSGNTYLNLNFIFEFCCTGKIALRRYAWPTDCGFLRGNNHACTHMPQKRMFSFFHHREVDGEVHDSGSVGVTELYYSGVLEGFTHGFTIVSDGVDECIKKPGND